MKIQIYSTLVSLLLAGCSAVSTPESTTSQNKIDPTTTEAPATQEPTPSLGTDESQTTESGDLTGLWSYGLTSIRTGEPLIEEGNEHHLDENLISFGYNQIIGKDGQILTPRGAPLQGGEQLILTEEYQEEHNMREYARIFTIMAPIRDTILYHFEETSKEEWLAITEVLTLNNIKTVDAPEVNGRSILSTSQVYDYIASGNAEGSPVMRYLEEAGLELKCLPFTDFDFTNPEGANHCQELCIVEGTGILLP